MFPKAKPRETLFPAGPVIKCFVIPPDSKLEKTAKKSFASRRRDHKFAAVSRDLITCEPKVHIVVSLES